MLLLAAPAAGADKAQELDGELLAACADYDALQTAIQHHIADAPPGGTQAHDDAMDVLTDRQFNALDRIVACNEPRTPEGLLALTEVARKETYLAAKPFPDTPIEESASKGQLLALMVFGSVTGRARA